MGSLNRALRATVLALPIGAAAVALGGCSSGDSTHSATLSIAQPERQLPGPAARSLELYASGEQVCPGDEELDDVTVDETDAAAVLVSASFRVDSSFDLEVCELRTAKDTATVQLQRPLGNREVVDVSGGGSSVIWSPELRDQHRRTAELTEDDALRFATSRFPEAADSKCIFVGIPYFECRYIRGGQRYRLILRTELGGRFSVFDRPIPDPTCPLNGGQPGCPSPK